MATITERILEGLGIAPVSRLQEVATAGKRQAARAYEQGYNDAVDMGANDEPPSGTLASYGYKAASRGGGRDWTKVSRAEAVDAAWALYVSSYIGRRVMHIKRDHLIGRSVTIAAADDELRELLEEFWTANKLRLRGPQFAMQLFLFGEQLFKLSVRASDGLVRVGYLDPGGIDSVVAHPDDAMQHCAVVCRKGAGVYRVYRVVRQAEAVEGEDGRPVEPQHPGRWTTAEQSPIEPWEEALLRQYDRTAYDGDVVYAAVNTVSNAPRGFPDLLPVYDLIVAADEVLFALAEREQFAGYFSFDVSIDGNPEDVEARRRALAASGPPRRGSLNVHNMAETWDMHAPNLQQGGSIDTFRALLGTVMGSMGFPVHWYGFGDDANRATATVQADPTHRSLEHDQGVVEDMLLTLLEFQRDQAIIAGASYEDESIDLVLPELSSLDLSRVAQSLLPIITAAMTAEDAGYARRETVMQIIAKIMKELDVEYDPAAEMEELDKTAMADLQTGNDALAAELNGNLG